MADGDLSVSEAQQLAKKLRVAGLPFVTPTTLDELAANTAWLAQAMLGMIVLFEEQHPEFFKDEEIPPCDP